MTLAIAVTTAPRPTPTLHLSLASLRAAGFRQPVTVFDDGPEDPACLDGRVAAWEPVRWIRNDPPKGGLRNWVFALRHLATDESCRDAAWLMVLEDDIRWAVGAAAALMPALSIKWPAPVGYLSLYLPRKVSMPIEIDRRGRLPPGWYRSKLAGDCWGSQAYILPRDAALELLEDADFRHTVATYEKNRNRDRIVSGALARLGRSLYYRAPCLVTHDWGNANSSLAAKPIQRALLTDYWTGRP